MSVSYGYCEAITGATYNISINSLFQQAVAEGMSIFVAAGDEGAASCDSGATMATHGISVDGFASTPYNVAAGGTDFVDVINGNTSKYWGGPNSNTTSYGSALSYIPEVQWNASCASTLLAQYNGYSSGYGAAGYCNSIAAQTSRNLAVAAGSGGPSNCATGAPSGRFRWSPVEPARAYAKPSWPSNRRSRYPHSDGVRDLPDVSMFASNGVFGHISILCFSDQSNVGSPCVGAPSSWAASGGCTVAGSAGPGWNSSAGESKDGRRAGQSERRLLQARFNHAERVSQHYSGRYRRQLRRTMELLPGILGTVDYGRNGRIFGTTWAGALLGLRDFLRTRLRRRNNVEFRHRSRRH